jgi:hypothetical protein
MTDGRDGPVVLMKRRSVANLEEPDAPLLAMMRD